MNMAKYGSDSVKVIAEQLFTRGQITYNISKFVFELFQTECYRRLITAVFFLKSVCNVPNVRKVNKMRL